MMMWWRDVIREAEFQGHHTRVVQICITATACCCSSPPR